MEGKNISDLKYWVAFSKIGLLGSVRFNKLLRYFGNLAAAWQADRKILSQSGLEEKIIDAIIKRRADISPDDEYEKIVANQIGIVTILDDNYPPLLKEIFSPPPLLYYHGELTGLKNFCLAVVGARKYSSYGKRATNEIIRDLAHTHITIVSGLALGIDALAHEAALDNHCPTVAVLGSGLDWPNIYPATNQKLAERIIAAGGTIISEYPLGTPGLKHHFPLRNRLISGLSAGVLIVEAREKSGSLITAQCALEQNRLVFALPGDIFQETSAGTNRLIQQGAKLVLAGNDILEEFNLPNINFSPPHQLPNTTPQEKIVLDIVTHEPLHIDKISQLSKLNISVLSGIIALMEIKGLIQDLGGKNYISLVK